MHIPLMPRTNFLGSSVLYWSGLALCTNSISHVLTRCWTYSSNDPAGHTCEIEEKKSILNVRKGGLYMVLCFLHWFCLLRRTYRWRCNREVQLSIGWSWDPLGSGRIGICCHRRWKLPCFLLNWIEVMLWVRCELVYKEGTFIEQFVSILIGGVMKFPSNCRSQFRNFV